MRKSKFRERNPWSRSQNGRASPICISVFWGYAAGECAENHLVWLLGAKAQSSEGPLSASGPPWRLIHWGAQISFSFIPIRVEKYMVFFFPYWPWGGGVFLEGSELVIDPWAWAKTTFQKGKIPLGFLDWVQSHHRCFDNFSHSAWGCCRKRQETFSPFTWWKAESQGEGPCHSRIQWGQDQGAHSFHVGLQVWSLTLIPGGASLWHLRAVSYHGWSRSSSWKRELYSSMRKIQNMELGRVWKIVYDNHHSARNYNNRN